MPKTLPLKKLRLLHFSMFFHETSKINVDCRTECYVLNLVIGFLKNYKKKWQPISEFSCPEISEFLPSNIEIGKCLGILIGRLSAQKSESRYGQF